MTNSETNISTSDLAVLGQCFAPTIPIAQFQKLSSSDFKSSISYFQGVTSQPNQAWMTEINNKIT
jgi:hypothetical protein